MPLRQCRKCDIEAHNEEELIIFRLDGKQPHGRQNICKACQSEYAKDWTRFAKYGITREDYNNMVESQNNSCAICSTTEPDGQYNTWHIDHCHSTGVVRGLLCSSCNLGLGMFKDNSEALNMASKYIEYWKEVSHP